MVPPDRTPNRGDCLDGPSLFGQVSLTEGRSMYSVAIADFTLIRDTLQFEMNSYNAPACICTNT